MGSKAFALSEGRGIPFVYAVCKVSKEDMPILPGRPAALPASQRTLGGNFFVFREILGVRTIVKNSEFFIFTARLPLCAFGLYVILGIVSLASLLCGRIWCHIRPLHLFAGTTYVMEGFAGSPWEHGSADGDRGREQGVRHGRVMSHDLKRQMEGRGSPDTKVFN